MSKIFVGYFDCNCYIIKISVTKCIVIDPSVDVNIIKNYLVSKNLTLEAILLTHGHIDHIYSLNDLCDIYKPKVYIHKYDKMFLIDNNLNLSAIHGKAFYFSNQDLVSYIENNQILIFEKLKITVYNTPGHTKGCVCYKIGNDLYSGDTLFSNGIGRTDFPTGNINSMRTSLNFLMKSFSNETIVYPGHGPKTTIKIEKQNLMQ